MAYSVRATKTFEDEYDAVLGYVVEKLKAPQAARTLNEALKDARRALAENPLLHAVSRKPLLEHLELRERLVRNYVVVYRVEEQMVYLEHIFHQTQDYERYFDEVRAE